MSDNERSWNLPTILLAVLAVFGITTIPQAQKARESESTRTAGAETATETNGIGHRNSTADGGNKPDLGALQPLEDYGRFNYFHHKHDNQDELLCDLNELPDTRLLIVTVPDPDDTSVSREFDSVVDAVLKAAGNLGFAPDRHAFPWDPETIGQKTQANPDSTIKGWFGFLPLSLSHSDKENEKPLEPASILCRRWADERKADEELLLLLLVPETPTLGVDADRLDAAIRLVQRQQLLRRGWSPEPIRIVGPNYTGSIPSLARGLRPYLNDDPPRKRFVVYNGSADAEPDSEELNSVFNPNRTQTANQVDFLSTVHRQPTLINELKFFLDKETLLLGGPRRVALLVETGTIFGYSSRDKRNGFELRLMLWGDGSGVPTSGKNVVVTGTDNNGLLHVRIFDATGNRTKDTDETQLPARAAAIATLKKRLPGLLPPHVPTGTEKEQVIAEVTSIVGQDQRHGVKPTVDYFTFPFGISHLREEYSARGFYQPNQPLRLSAPERLSLQSISRKKGDRDRTPVFAPGTANLEAELALTQILQELARGCYDTIGIVSTDPYDRLFLAFKIREFCPNVRLAFTSSTSLFAHPDMVPYLRGSLVVSSYPLHLANQARSIAYSSQRTRVPMASFQQYSTEGVYNATAAQLGELYEEDPPLLDYGVPGSILKCGDVPPIWISVVGERQLYPLRAVVPENERNKEVSAEDLYRAPPSRLALRLVSWGDGSGMPTSEKRLIIVGTDNSDLLHIRIFDGAGNCEDKGETQLRDQAVAIMALKKRLPDLSRRELTDTEKAEVIAEVESIVGPHTDKNRLTPRLSTPWVVTFLVIAIGLGFLSWLLCLGSWLEERRRRRLGRFVMSSPLARWIDSPTGRRVVALTITASLGQLLILGLPAWGVVRLLAAGQSGWGQRLREILLILLVLLVGMLGVTLGVAASLVALYRLIGAGRPARLGRSEAWLCRLAAAVAAAQVVLAVGVVVEEFSLHDWDIRNDCERLATFTSGVTPLVPMLLVGTAGAAAALAGFQRWRYQERMPLAARPGSAHDYGPSEAQDLFDQVRRRLDDARHFLSRPLSAGPRCERWPWNLLACGLALVLLALMLLGLPGSLERPFLQSALLLASLVSLVAIELRLIELIGLYRAQTRARQAIARLPMVRAFDRLPKRLLRPGLDTLLTTRPDRPAPGDPDPILDYQYQVLARGCDATKPGPWMLLKQVPSLPHRSSLPSEDWWTAIDQLLPTLRNEWSRRAVADAFAVTSSSGETPSYEDDDGYWPGLPADGDDQHRTPPGGVEHPGDGAADVALEAERPVVSRSAGTEPEAEADPEDARRWLNEAEEFLALVLSRHLEWIHNCRRWLAAALVVGLLALTLTTTSYPFQGQGPMMPIVSLLGTITAALVLWNAVQTSRDEVVSRIIKTTPNRFTLDREFVTTLVTSILPLFGILALSYKVSDLLRAWLEPIFR